MRLHPEKVHKKYIIININNNGDNSIYIEAHCHEILEKQKKRGRLKNCQEKQHGYLQRNRNQNSNDSLKHSGKDSKS